MPTERKSARVTATVYMTIFTIVYTNPLVTINSRKCKTSEKNPMSFALILVSDGSLKQPRIQKARFRPKTYQSEEMKDF